MASEVAPMQAIADKVRDKIKEQFADLIPDDVYKTMVEAALKEFVSKDLPGLVKEEAKKHLLVIIGEELKNPEWLGGSAYNPNSGEYRQLASEMVTKLLRENSAFIVEAMMGTVVQQMVNQMRGRY